jgi:hypothetical protein
MHPIGIKGIREVCKLTPRKVVLYLRLLVAGFATRRPGFKLGSGRMGFVVDKVALGRNFSEYFSFSWQFLFHRLLHTHHHLSAGAGTRGSAVGLTTGYGSSNRGVGVRVPVA